MLRKTITLDPCVDVVHVGETPVGKGVFAARSFPRGSLIGEIKGDLVSHGMRDSSYTFEMDEQTELDPHAPYRFLNHCCEPNCEFDSFEDAGREGEFPPLYLIALREIRAGEELTIDYNWPASSTIPCNCSADACRGWIVSLDEIHLLRKKRPRAR